MNLDEWVHDVDERVIGAGQCWDLAQDYVTRVCNGGVLNTQVSTHPGYAIGVWDGYGANGVESFMGTAPASATMLPGWVPVWRWGSPQAPFSHIAVGLKDLGIALQVDSQNPGPAGKMTLLKAGLAGYLVPHTMGGTPDTTGRNASLAGSVTLAGDSNPITDTLGNLKGVADFAANVQHFFNTPGIWQRVGVYLIGGVILLAALVYMFKDQAQDLAEGIVK